MMSGIREGVGCFLGLSCGGCMGRVGGFDEVRCIGYPYRGCLV